MTPTRKDFIFKFIILIILNHIFLHFQVVFIFILVGLSTFYHLFNFERRFTFILQNYLLFFNFWVQKIKEICGALP